MKKSLLCKRLVAIIIGLFLVCTLTFKINSANVTDSVAVNAEKLYLKDHATTNGSSYGNFLTCQKVSDTEVHIYQYHPGNGAALWKVTYIPAEEPTAVENTTATVKVQKLMRDGQVLMVRDGKTFNMMGQEIR